MSDPKLDSGTTRPPIEDLPKEWKVAQLGDVATLIQGGRLRLTKERHYRSSGVAAFSAAGNDGYVDLAEFSEPGIVLSAIGAQCGKCFYADGTWTTLANTQAIIPRREEIWPRFLFHRVAQPDYWPKSGTAQPFIKPSDVRKCWLAFPLELNEQRAIASILDAADEAIAKTEALIAKLKAIEQGLLHDLLTRGLDDNGELRDPEKHPEQFKDTPLGRFPVAWETPTVNDLATHVGSGITPAGGSNVYQHRGVLFIRSQNVTFDGLLLDDVAYIDERTHQTMARSEVFAHDVLLNITGASIGRCCPMPEGLGPANVNQHVCVIRTSKPRRADAIVLSAILASFIGQRQIDRLNAGSNRQGLNYQQLRSFLIPWPKRESERDVMAERIEAADSRVRAEEAYLSKLKAIKKGLMQDLLTGRVRVNTDQVVKER